MVNIVNLWGVNLTLNVNYYNKKLFISVHLRGHFAHTSFFHNGGFI
jgi:hypothetical protein